jgi:hypothetical protein
MMKNKKAQSQIITTVILILLSLAAAVILFSFVIPFVKDNLSGGACIEVVGKMEILSSRSYTCYRTSEGNMSIQIHIGEVKDLIDGFIIELDAGPSTKTYKIKEETSSEIWMRNGTKSTNIITLPENNEARTYLLPSADQPTQIKLYPILEGGKVCDLTSHLDFIDPC